MTNNARDVIGDQLMGERQISVQLIQLAVGSGELITCYRHSQTVTEEQPGQAEWNPTGYYSVSEQALKQWRCHSLEVAIILGMTGPSKGVPHGWA